MMTQTWSAFTASDLTLAAIGLLGLASVVIVFSTASGNVAKRELSLRKNARAQSNAADS